MFHAGGFPEPSKQIEQARAILEFLVSCCSLQQAAGLLLKEELDVLRMANNDTYVFHEYLERNNDPLYFHEFVRRARAHGLQYLADADFSTMVLQNLPEKARETFRGLPLVQQEQYMDFIRGRRFRRTLLCHAGVPLNRNLSADLFKKFHFAAAGKFEAAKVDIRNEDPSAFRCGNATLSTTSRLVKAALMHLKEVYPRFIPFGQLCATALARVHSVRPMDPQDPKMRPDVVASAMMQGYMAGLIAICLHPPRRVTEGGPRPMVSALARLQAAQGAQLTNTSHQTVTLDPLSKRIVRRLDGKHDRPALMESVREAIAAGEVVVKKGDRKVTNPDAETLANVLDRALGSIAEAGLLEG